MGIPAFFRWIIERYPKCLKPAVEVDENIFLLNKNGEFDSLYIDANDLLHTAVHPESAASPKTFKHMMENFLFLLEQQVKIIRPRSLLYIAFDGVAPRAKMNLQRARRYRVAKEAQMKKEYIEKIESYREKHEQSNDEEVEPKFDFSCITPGTPFMRDVSDAVQAWIRKMQLDNSYWSNLYVVVDDSSVAGEGEHKIMQRIRSARQHPNYNPQNSIAISGRDADLIILGLATHEPNISILRQVTYFGKMVRCPMCFRAGHARECVYPPKALANNPEVGYALFSLKTFRSFLWSEFREASQRHDPDIDFELMVNDYVLMTFFVGNDFLPRLAGTCIRNGTLDLMIECYITFVTIHGKTLTSSKGQIDPVALKKFLKLVGLHEKEIVGSLAKLNRNNIYKKKKKKKDENSSFYKFSSGAFGNDNTEKMKENRDELGELFPMAIFHETSIPWFNGLKKSEQIRYLDLAMFEVPAFMRGRNRVFKALGQWKKRYYANCFSLNIPSDVRDHDLFNYPEVTCILTEYMRGLQWVFQYYIDKNPNWEWFYPFAYGPCVTDLEHIDFNPDQRFTPDEPISPLISLMAVLPPRSIHLLPEVFHPLITLTDSPIADLYPESCHVDYSDAFYWWQGIMHLPYMETERLSTAVLPEMSKLSEEHLKLNEFGRPILICCSPISELGESLHREYTTERSGEEMSPPKLHVKDEFAVFGRAVEAIQGFEIETKEDGKISSVAAYLVPHDLPPLDFKIKDGVGYDPNMQGHSITRQRFGALASSRKATILNQRREMVKEMRVMGHTPKRNNKGRSAGSGGRNNKKPNVNIDMLMQAFQMLQMAGANPEQLSQLFDSGAERNSGGSRRERENFREDRHREDRQDHQNHPMMSVPNPVAVGHGGRQPYQSVMKPMQNEKKEGKQRHGEPDPDNQAWNNQNFNPMNAMQQMAALLQMNMDMQQNPMSPMAGMLSQMVNQMSHQMSPQQMMAMLMSQAGPQQQQQQMMSPRSPMGMNFPNQQNMGGCQNMMQQMQQQMMMQNMMNMFQAQQMSDYGSDDGSSMMGGGMGMQNMMQNQQQMDNGFGPNNIIDSMMNQAMGPGSMMAPQSPSHRFASPPANMDSPNMSGAHSPAPDSFQSNRQMTPTSQFGMPSPGPGMNGMGFWPSSPQANSPSPFNMNQNMPMSPQGMNPMSQQNMNPPNQNMNMQMFNQMNPQGYMQNQANANNQTRI